MQVRLATRLFPESAKKRTPVLETSMPLGVLKPTLVPNPVRGKPISVEPAIVVTSAVAIAMDRTGAPFVW